MTHEVVHVVTSPVGGVVVAGRRNGSGQRVKYAFVDQFRSVAFDAVHDHVARLTEQLKHFQRQLGTELYDFGVYQFIIDL